MKLKSVTGLGIGLSILLLSGCSVQLLPDQFSYKTVLAEKEKAITGFDEPLLVQNNSYADKVEKDNGKGIVYFAIPENRSDKVPKLSQKELAKLANAKPKLVIPDDKIYPNSQSFTYMGTIDQNVKQTEMVQKLEASQADMKIDTQSNKEQAKTLDDLVQQLNAERVANGEAPIEQ